MNKKKSSKKAKAEMEKTANSFPIVGIGASAGGLEALEGFFKKMPSDSNMAFIIIQHLAPKHKSMMPELLSKYTGMETIQVRDDMTIEPNCIYLNPPDKYMSITSGILHLTDPTEQHGARLSIDYFFRTLAEDRGEKGICIILSGTGTDGTLGLKAIKGAGGMTMVQQEKQAKYDGMPRSAIDTGLVDFILPVERMPGELLKYIKHPYIDGGAKKPETEEDKYQKYLQRIFDQIQNRTGHDFSNYKQNTIRRRIERRMAVHQISNIADYVELLRKNAAEIDSLYKDLLIGVTNFFRDPEAFNVLKERAILELLKKKPTNSTMRIWVPGCATGEEAYSLAIVLIEAMEKMSKHAQIQIFATDIDAEAVDYARTALYPESIAADVSAQRLKRFFKKEDNSYRVNKQIREMVIFAAQNLIKDPPFSKLDMVSCRNLLIYMDQKLQKKIVPLLHYTLKPEGILFLGSSESIGAYTDLFTPMNSKWKIFRRKGGAVLEGALEYPNFAARAAERPDNDGPKPFPRENVRELAEKIILDKYTPASVLVNERSEILYFHGNTEYYLAPPTGEPTFNIMNLAREGLKYKLSAAINKAVKYKKPVTEEALQIKSDEKFRTVDLIVRPIEEPSVLKGLLLVVFDDKTPVEKSGKKKKSSKNKETDPRISALEQELYSTRQNLQSTIEELEASNEELKSTNEELQSTNEELQSTNEELQSTNEELETSKEELQSTNEELATVNSELENKVDELSQANNDLNNLLASTEIGTIFLDPELNIKRFTPKVEKIFNLRQSDIGRPISDLTSNLRYESMSKDAEQVLNTLERKEMEVQTKDNNWFSVHILPYRTTDNVIDGVVITFVDITNRKKIEQKYERVINDLKQKNKK